MDEATAVKFKVFTKDGYLYETNDLIEKENKVIVVKPIHILKSNNEGFSNTKLSKNKNYDVYFENISYIQKPSD